MNQKKAIYIRRGTISLKFLLGSDYIEYKYLQYDKDNSELDSNAISFEDFNNIKIVMSEIANDIEILKIKSHLEHGEKYKNYFLAFMSYFNKTISEVGYSTAWDETLEINAPNKKGYYIFPTPLKETIAQKISNEEFKSMNVPISNEFSIFEFNNKNQDK